MKRTFGLFIFSLFAFTACESGDATGGGNSAPTLSKDAVTPADAGGNDTSTPVGNDTIGNDNGSGHEIDTMTEMPPILVEWKKKVEEAPWLREGCDAKCDPLFVHLTIKLMPDVVKPLCPDADFLLDIAENVPNSYLCIDAFTADELMLSYCKYDASICDGWQIKEGKVYEENGKRLLNIKWSAGKGGENSLIQQPLEQ